MITAILEWLAGSWLGQAIFKFLESEIVGLIKGWVDAVKAKIALSKKFDQIDKDAKDSAQKLEQAKTKEEIDAGVDDILNKF